MQVVIKSRRTVVRGRIYHHITAIEGDLLRTGNLPLDYVETDGYWIVSESTGEPRTRAVLIRQGNEHIASIVPGIDIESGRFEELCDRYHQGIARSPEGMSGQCRCTAEGCGRVSIRCPYIQCMRLNKCHKE